MFMAVGRFFFSAAQPAQNSPELHFRFLNSFIQPSLLESLDIADAAVLRLCTVQYQINLVLTFVSHENTAKKLFWEIAR
jgi:hypothetical protein